MRLIEPALDALACKGECEHRVLAKTRRDVSYSPVAAADTSSAAHAAPAPVEPEHLDLPRRDDDKDLRPALVLRALARHFPVMLALKETLLRPGCAEKSELLVGHLDRARLRGVVVFALFADDRVRETVGEADCRDGVMLRRQAVGGIPALLRGPLS